MAWGAVDLGVHLTPGRQLSPRGIPDFSGCFCVLQLQDPKGHASKAQGTSGSSQSPLERAGQFTPSALPGFPPHVPSTLQSRLQTQLKTLKTEMDEAKAQGTQMGAENGALTGVLGRRGAEQG